MTFSEEKFRNLAVVQKEIVSLIAKYGYTYEEAEFILNDIKSQLLKQVVQFLSDSGAM